MSRMKLKTPFVDLLPPLSSDEFEALKADIKANGVRVPIDVDEDGNILDGHHRYKCDPDCPRNVVKGLSDAEKKAFVARSNFVRRNLSPNQKAEALRWMKATAAELREADAKKWTQKRIASVLGVTQQAVAKWFISDTTSCNANTADEKPDARIKLGSKEREYAVAAVESGKKQEQVAADLGVSQATVSNAVRRHAKEQEQLEVRRGRAERAKQLGDMGIVVGDFREHGKDVPDESVDLIFTDPPYDRETLPQYRDLGWFAARTLKPGGSLITYLGDYQLPAVLELLLESPDLRFWWPLACIHGGATTKMMQWGVMVRHKLMLWIIKGKTRANKDLVASAIESQPDKEHHDWGQSLVEARYYIERLTPVGGMVVDPFCGGGTTPAAAKFLGRQWLAFEINEQTALEARGRIAGL